MEQKQRLFIYDRREVVILVALGLMVAAFAFTLGVHLGKRVTTRAVPPSTAEVNRTGTLQDSLPNKQELTEQARSAETAADDELTKSLHEEVQKTGMKLDTPRQVDLPSQTKSRNAGATDTSATDAALANTATPNAVNDQSQEKPGALEKTLYTLQIGSFPTAEEAQSKMDELRTQGLRPYVRPAEVSGLGKRFRLFVGEFSSREIAEKAGRRYQSDRVIQSFLVSRFE